MKLIFLKQTLAINLLLFALMPTTYATWQPYVGINIGLSKSQNTFTGYLTNIVGSGNTKLNMDTTGTSESLLLGIRNQQTDFFYAFEFFTSIHQFATKRKGNNIFRVIDANNMARIGTYDFEVNQKYTEGLSCYFGKDLTPNLDAFLKLDLLLSQFTIKTANTARTSSHGQESKWLFGFAPGVGLQYHFTKSISARFDYSYRIYNEFKSKNIANDLVRPTTTNVTGKISPRIHQFTLALLYKF
jgi:opacity protein-like surface antigen